MTLRILLVILAAACTIPAQVAQTGATPAQPQPKGRVEGRVVSSTTGEPLRKATLRLRTVGGVGVGGSVGVIGAMPNMSTIVAASDAEGKFAFEDVDAGQYMLTAERSGFVSQSYSESGRSNVSSALSVPPGQEIKGIVLKMVPQAVISGKIVDEDGDPIPGANVQVLRYAFNGRGRQLMPMMGAASSPDGTFMIGNLAAGKYYLSANSNRMFSDGPERSAGRARESYVATYFPSATEISAATPIEVVAGQDVRGIDIRMRKQAVYSVRGKLVGEGPVQNTALIMIPKGQENIFTLRHQSFIRNKEGDFAFNNVPPGTYTIHASPNRPNGESPQIIGRMDVTITDRDIDDLQVPMSPLGEITGTIKIEGVEWAAGTQQAEQNRARNEGSAAPGTPGANPPNRPAINLQLTEGIMFNNPNARAGDDGSFVLKNVAPGKYRVNVNILPDGTYIKSIRYGSQDVTKGELDLSGGASGTLDILLSPKAGDISGVVRDANGTGISKVQVLAWIPGGGDPPRTSMTDQNGNFKIRNLGPGDYKVIASQEVELGLRFDPDFRKEFESQAVSVSVKESSHESAEVKLTPKDVIDAVAAKFK